MSEMHVGQSIEDAVGKPVEAVGRRASPLMAAAHKIAGVVSRVMSFAGDLLEPSTPGDRITSIRSASVLDEVLAIDDRGLPPMPAAVGAPKPTSKF